MVSGRCHSGLRGPGRRRSSRLFLRTREPVEIVLSDFRERWLQGLKNDGLQVGVNWSATATALRHVADRGRAMLGGVVNAADPDVRQGPSTDTLTSPNGRLSLPRT
ncbi:DUF2750 domain-containing protein [Kribbella orskensis]|uniref:DUF2750 domain-containing protein n=1 Tax=Kribbella TaxID=182639 RepID=UPI0018EE6011